MSSSGSHVETVSTIVEVEGLNIGGMGRGLKVQTIKLKFWYLLLMSGGGKGCYSCT